MPIYEYKCQACGHELELLQKISDQPARECPACHAQTLQKLISAAGFQLKGSGWYVTDFKDKGKSKGETPVATDKASATSVNRGDTTHQSTTSSSDVPSTTSDN